MPASSARLERHFATDVVVECLINPALTDIVAQRFESTLFLYYPGRRQLSPAPAAFIDAIRVPAKPTNGR